MMRVLWLVALVAGVAACYQPSYPNQYPCRPDNPKCPEGLECNGTICVPKGSPHDGTKPVDTKPVDTRPVDDRDVGSLLDLPRDLPRTGDGPCNTGQTAKCYTGPAGTEGKGICIAGTRTCVDGGWGTCKGQVTPVAEVCEDSLDNDCDGMVDNGCPCGGAGTCQGCCAGTICKKGDEDGACGLQGAKCQACASPAVCYQGVCCTAKCVGKCMNASDECGRGCPSNQCGGCCDPSFVCHSSEHDFCGTAGTACVACAASEVCYGGKCCAPKCAGKCAGASNECGGTCATSQCAGCCDASLVCRSSSNATCGTGGGACKACTGSQVCYQGSCCTPSCAGKCLGASNGCGGTCGTNQCTGCCDSSLVCRSSSDATCGTGGEACSACAAPQVCDQGNCCTPSCTNKCPGQSDGCGKLCPGNTCTGCCATNGCQAGTTSQYCGAAGVPCSTCTSPAFCRLAVCCTPTCTNKCQYQSDGCGGQCPTNTCSGCCDTTGTCKAGTEGNYCGNAGVACQNCWATGGGSVQCNPTTKSCCTCPTQCATTDCGGACNYNRCYGCCTTAHVCSGPSDAFCGLGGSPCVDCAAQSKHCSYSSYTCY